MKQSLNGSKRIYISFIVLSFFITTSASAAMYKSVDEEGNVSYSQSPPKSGNYKTITVKKYKPTSPDAAKRINDARKSIEQGTEDRKQNKLLKAELDKNKKIMADNCKIAKKNLRLFTVYKKLKNEQGEYYRVTDTERAQRIKAAKENIKQYCK